MKSNFLVIQRDGNGNFPVPEEHDDSDAAIAAAKDVGARFPLDTIEIYERIGYIKVDVATELVECEG